MFSGPEKPHIQPTRSMVCLGNKAAAQAATFFSSRS